MAPVLYETRGRVAIITLNRPAKHNSLTPEVLELLARHAEAAQHDHHVRAIVVTGTGDRAFCAGGDLAELIPQVASGAVAVVPDPAKRFFSDIFKPVIAAVNGLCIAGGLEIMLGTDLRIAASHATFGLGEVRWGVIPAAGSHVRLPRQIPWAIAMQMLLTATPINAARAYEVGLVNEIVEGPAVLERAIQLANEIADNAPLAVETAKEIAVRALALEPAFALEHALAERVLRSDDAREGPRAFTERRQPNWSGH
ncbi:enoyl-CoA hydratase/isomerase family protein [Nocardiaceae bacterium YC2-7]|uniref:Enoyl-CoA hydratase/isomerase family protein n=1 Tax=Antrihabitans stalactiti TaxID=2584121 RepID=A0A848KC72_9NOCA|nr:enoyl-CoA hydratase-related protein [Antrihabitans stalactiti]NMN95901.1 enoyl-CoA hydratase/isomerase family protein [Antrihabitans stalactiti]